VDVRLEGSGAWTFAAHLVCQALRRRGLEERSRFAVWVDGAGGLHPPALFALGVPPERFLLTRPSSAADALWAFDQALRCRQVAVAVADLTRLEMPHLRRLQLAAREGGGLAILLRPAAEARNPSAAAARLGVRPLASVNSAVKPVNGPATADPMDVRLFAFAVEVLRARGGWGGGGVRVNVQWNVEHPHGAAAHPLHCVSTPLE
jgi:hypothetical protein